MPMYFGGAPYAGSGISTARPAATAVPAGTTYFASDLGENGTLLMSNGTRWRTVNGAPAALKTLGAASANVNNVETIVLQTLLPAGAWQVNDTLRIWLTGTKSGSTDTGNLSVRIGTLGTTADAPIGGLSGLQFMAASGLAGAGIFDIKLNSNTLAQKLGVNANASHAYQALTSTSAVAAAVAISDAAANALYVSLSLTSGGATNTMQLTSGQIQLITP